MSMERPVSSIMRRRPPSVRPANRVRDALALAREHEVEHILVVESDNVVGIVCTCDLSRARPDTAVSACMKASVVTVDGVTTLREAGDLMRSRRVGCLPVTAGRLLMGIVTRSDLKRAGVPDDLCGAVCASCGSRHHLGASAGGASPFCIDCLECAEVGEPELGMGD